MDAPVTILIAHSKYLFRQLLKNLVHSQDKYLVTGKVSTKECMMEAAKKLQPQIVIAELAMAGRGYKNFTALKECTGAHLVIIWKYGQERLLLKAIQQVPAAYIAYDAQPPEYFDALRRIKKQQLYCNRTQELLHEKNHKQPKYTEKYLLLMLCQCLSYTIKETAQATALSELTIPTYRKRMKQLTSLRSMFALMQFMKENGML